MHPETEDVVRDIQDALTRLGVNDETLTPTQKRSLDERGYVVLEGVIAPEWLEPLRDAYESLMNKAASVQPHGREAGTRRLFDLENQGELFDGIYTHPSVLAAAYNIFGRDFRFVTLNGRDAEPGEGHQVLHRDWSGTGSTITDRLSRSTRRRKSCNPGSIGAATEN